MRNQNLIPINLAKLLSRQRLIALQSATVITFQLFRKNYMVKIV